MDRHLRRLRDPLVEARQQCATAGQHDPLVHDVGDQLGWRLLDGLLDGLDDLRHGRLQGLADLVPAHLDAARQSGEQVATPEGDRPLIRDRVGRADGDLDLFRGSLAHQQVVLPAREADDVGVHLIATDPVRSAHDDAAQADHGNFGGAASDVDDERSRRFAHRKAGADGGGHRLLDQARPSSSGVDGRVPDGPLLHLGDAGGNPDQHPRTRDAGVSVVHLLDEVMNHLLGDVEVADHPVAQRPDGDDVGGGAADHPLRLRADGEHALGTRVHGDDARLADHDPPVPDRDERVGRAEVDAHVVREQAEQAVEDAQDASGS